MSLTMHSPGIDLYGLAPVNQTLSSFGGLSIFLGIGVWAIYFYLRNRRREKDNT